MIQILAVGLGGFLGSIFRYLLSFSKDTKFFRAPLGGNFHIFAYMGVADPLPWLWLVHRVNIWTDTLVISVMSWTKHIIKYNSGFSVIRNVKKLWSFMGGWIYRALDCVSDNVIPSRFPLFLIEEAFGSYMGSDIKVVFIHVVFLNVGTIQLLCSHKWGVRPNEL